MSPERATAAPAVGSDARLNAVLDAVDAAAPLCPLRLDLLQTFVVASEEATLSKAARRLYLTPSGVSRRLHALETQLGTLLFDRQDRSMPLTPAGQRLLPEAVAFVAAARRIVAALEAGHDQRGLEIVRQERPTVRAVADIGTRAGR